jgi:hypothetical protein
MPEQEQSKILQTLSRVEKLEREINLKQIQIKSLLAIAQAINENVSAQDLLNMYNSFLRWEIGIRKMAMFYKEPNSWRCVTSLGVSEDMLEQDLSEELFTFGSMQTLDKVSHPLMKEFDLVIPVLKKGLSIAYVFIGGFSDDEDVYSKVQFVTTISNVIAIAVENLYLFNPTVYFTEQEIEIIKSGKIYVDKYDGDYLFLKTLNVKDKGRLICVEIYLEKTFETYKAEDLEHLLTELKKFAIYPKVLSIASGSTIIALEMSGEEAEMLFVLIKTGKLKKFGILNAKLKGYKIDEMDGIVGPDESKSAKVNGVLSDKEKIKLMIVSDPEVAIEMSQKCIKTSSRSSNDFLLLKRRIVELKHWKATGQVEHGFYSLEMQKISDGILHTIDEVPPEDYL